MPIGRFLCCLDFVVGYFTQFLRHFHTNKKAWILSMPLYGWDMNLAERHCHHRKRIGQLAGSSPKIGCTKNAN